MSINGNLRVIHPHRPSMQVTVSLLPVSLSLVHIPRSRLPQLSHPILRQILQSNPVFLNVTSNQIELSIFADSRSLEEFELIARRDRHKQRSRSGSASSARQTFTHEFEPIEISYEKWRVLQIDSHNSSGARAIELSAPLAAAGISILYQSSYMCDYIFVKETRLHEALDLLSAAGFDLYTDTGFSTPDELTGSNHESGAGLLPSSGAILTRCPSSTNSSFLSAAESLLIASSDNDDASTDSPRSHSHSPCIADVRLLPTDLACVGLSDELGIDHWGLKIVKLVAFPDLISPVRTTTGPHPKLFHENLKHPSRPTSPSMEKSKLSDLFSSYKAADVLLSPMSSLSSDDEDDGYFSHSPQNRQLQSKLTSQSQPDLTKVSLSRPSKHTPLSASIVRGSDGPTVDMSTSLSPKQMKTRVPFFSFTRTAEGSSLTTDVYLLATLFPPHERHMVICGGELDAIDDRLIASQEYSDDEVDNGVSSDSQGNILKCLQIDLRQFGLGQSCCILFFLSFFLIFERGTGILDKHGLVNRFSRVLGEHGINLMYSSTFKTANLLVS
ncbi:hypothetical protein AMATHDRAFT_142951 [Amanita thiersii Skay4041]|uniref:CASTOR ACT domain-containing protein n=1 Tax=Amanita thiersii Skay4041 TaxID=703135 RepID=A0A2A9NU45_9AGAR|nr:hypothetical protein AMATHDRAFT_142951 [Amanita thiersii Skay4041]